MFTVGLVGKLLIKSKCLAGVDLGDSAAPIIKLVVGLIWLLQYNLQGN